MVSNAALLNGSVVVVLLTISEAVPWAVGVEEGSSCASTCTALGATCNPEMHLSINRGSTLKQLVEDTAGIECYMTGSWGGMLGYTTDHPGSQECYYPAEGSTPDCSYTQEGNWKNLCYCQMPGATTPEPMPPRPPTPEGCFEHGISYGADEYASGGSPLTEFLSFEFDVDCQEACQLEEQCEFWTHRGHAYRWCVLYSSGSDRQASLDDVVSGPKYCGEATNTPQPGGPRGNSSGGHCTSVSAWTLRQVEKQGFRPRRCA